MLLGSPTQDKINEERRSSSYTSSVSMENEKEQKKFKRVDVKRVESKDSRNVIFHYSFV